MRPQIRSGIIGTGFIGRVHLKAVRAAGGFVEAVAGFSREEAEESAQELNVPRGLTAEELIADPNIDLVHICTPNSTHFELAKAAIAAGKHVICEKPLATTAAEAAELLEAAEAAGVVTGVPFVYRYYPTVREIRERLRVGEERPWFIHGNYLQDWLLEQTDYNWRIDDGASRAFGDIGVHWCDLVEFVTGQRIDRIYAHKSQIYSERFDGASMVPVKTEDAVGMLFETDRGASGVGVLSQATAGRKNQLTFSVDTEQHSYSFDHENPEQLLVGARVSTEIVQRGQETTQFDAVGQYVTVPSGHPQGFLDCFIGFITDIHRVISGEEVEGLPTFADGARAALLTEAAMESAADSLWTSIPALQTVSS